MTSLIYFQFILHEIINDVLAYSKFKELNFKSSGFLEN